MFTLSRCPIYNSIFYVPGNTLAEKIVNFTHMPFEERQKSSDSAREKLRQKALDTQSPVSAGEIINKMSNIVYAIGIAAVVVIVVIVMIFVGFG